jgi:hypothetical protein
MERLVGRRPANEKFKQPTAPLGRWTGNCTGWRFQPFMEQKIMRRRISTIGWVVVAVLGSVAVVRSAEPETPKIDPKAEEYLKGMCTYMAGLHTFSFQVEEMFDETQDDGQKLQLGNQRHMSVSRPDKMFGESEGDTKNSQFFYDGKTATVYDRAQKTYAVEKVPATIDGMLDDLHERFATNQTLSDFLFADSYKVFTENVESGAYIGEHYVGKVKCHHLAFRQKNLDWQIWIEEGEKPLPRKFVITFKQEPDQPQFTALFHRWDENPTLSDEMFQFQPPNGLRKVDFLNRHAEPKPAKNPEGK